MLPRPLSLLIAIAAAALIAVPSANAATFAVNTTADAADSNTGDGICKTAANACSLRAALQQANFSAGADAVTVPAGTYPLTLGSALPISNSVTLSGAGARDTVIDGTGAPLVLAVTGGASTVRGLTFANASEGVYVQDAEAVFDQVAIRNNTLTGGGNGSGAGLLVYGATADVQLLRSAVTANKVLTTGSQALGAGVSLQNGAKLTAVESTIANNAVGGDTALTRATIAYGGGLGINIGSATLRHVTLTGNSVAATSSAAHGANVAVFAAAGNGIRFEDSLVTGAAENCFYSGVAPTLAGRNLDSGTTCSFGLAGLNNADPLLRPLGAFGGTTDTAPPKPGSPALNAAAACEPGGDQRGAPPAGACDIGAAELSTDLAVTVQSSRASVAPGGDVTHLLTVTNAGPDTATAVTLGVGAPGGQFSIAAPSSGSCTLAVQCDLGDLAPGASATVTVVVMAGATGPLLMSATAGAGTPEVNDANNGVAVNTAVTGGSVQPGGDTVAPVLGALKLSGKAKTKKPITVKSTLSEAATLTLKLDRLTAGRKAGKTCKTGLRKGKRCTIVKKVGTRTVTAAAGGLKLVIPAKFPKKAIPKGTYRLTVTAKDAAGNTSKARTLTLTVKR